MDEKARQGFLLAGWPCRSGTPSRNADVSEPSSETGREPQRPDRDSAHEESNEDDVTAHGAGGFNRPE